MFAEPSTTERRSRYRSPDAVDSHSSPQRERRIFDDSPPSDESSTGRRSHRSRKREPVPVLRMYNNLPSPGQRYDRGSWARPVLEARRDSDRTRHRKRNSTSTKRPPAPDINDFLFERPNDMELQRRPPPFGRTPSKRMSQSSSPKRAPTRPGLDHLEYMQRTVVDILLHEAGVLAHRVKMQRDDDPTAVRSRQLEDVAFGLNVWVKEARVMDLEPGDVDSRVVDLANNVLRCMSQRGETIRRILAAGNTVADSTEPTTPNVDILDQSSDDEQHAILPTPPSETPASQLRLDTQALEIQLRTLRRLTRSFSNAVPSGYNKAIEAHVSEVKKHFGTEAACVKFKARVEDWEGLPTDVLLQEAQSLM